MVIDKEGNVTGFYGGYPYSAIVSVVGISQSQLVNYTIILQIWKCEIKFTRKSGFEFEMKGNIFN